MGYKHSKNWSERRAAFVNEVGGLIGRSGFVLPDELVEVVESEDYIELALKKWGFDSGDGQFQKDAPTYEPQLGDPKVRLYYIDSPTEEQRRQAKEECARLNEAFRCGIFMVSGL
jgi:hypothetical protein